MTNGIIDSSQKIITNGLVLNYDAAQLRSYPGTGTVITDLSGNSNNGTLVNGVGFNSSNGGSLVFDGVNDYLNCGTILNYTTGNFTFSCWVYITSLSTNTINQGPILFWKGNYNSNGYYSQIESNGGIIFVTNSPSARVTTSSISITAGNIYNISFVRNGSSVKIYVNGVDKTLTAASHLNPSSSSNNFILGSYNLTQINSNIRIFSFSNYNRQLSATEITQNFNANRSRYGL